MKRDWMFLQAVVINTLAALLYALAAGVIALGIACLIEYGGIEKPFSDDDQTLLQNFLGWFAAIYALASGAIIGQSWAKLNKLNSEIDREADALALLVRTAKMCAHSDLAKSLSLAVRVYVAQLRILNVHDNRFNSETYNAMKEIYNCLHRIIADDKDTKDCIKSELLHQYSEAYDARSDRFDLVDQRVPRHIWWILAGSSLAWLWGFFWLKIDAASLSIFTLLCMLFFLTYTFGLARDLDNPLTGFWRIKFTAFKENEF